MPGGLIKNQSNKIYDINVWTGKCSNCELVRQETLNFLRNHQKVLSYLIFYGIVM